ncbi:MAG: Gfo/Idh/MocA family oxidoreductase, partial [Pedosphaera sp.]|nr:Gfo/Idh/MocA family oxidoreductase [Pedosphaera sp.]
NEKIQVGVIGAGGRAQRLMHELVKMPGVEITALCDIFDVNLAKARQIAPKAATTDDFHTLLKRKDVDAVLIGSPDHWHVPMTVAACAAGKDVYVEKPLTHTLEEGAAVIRAQNEHKRVVQVGTQQRSMPQFQKAKELIEQGALGKVHKIHMSWNRNHAPFKKRVPDIKPHQVDWERFLGNAPRQPFEPYRFHRNWRWFWDFGGGILTDLMVHWMDSVHYLWPIGLPESTTSIGAQYTTKGAWETPDTIQTLMEFPKHGTQLHFEGTFSCQHRKAGTTLMGENATVYIDRGRLELTPEPGRKAKPIEMVLGKGGKGADFSSINGEALHLADWLQAVRERRKPSAPAEAGVAAAAVAHLGNQAYREGKVIHHKG